MPCERRPIPKNRGGARSDRTDTGRLPAETAIFSSQRSRTGSVLDMTVTAPLGSQLGIRNKSNLYSIIYS